MSSEEDCDVFDSLKACVWVREWFNAYSMERVSTDMSFEGFAEVSVAFSAAFSVRLKMNYKTENPNNDAEISAESISKDQ